MTTSSPLEPEYAPERSTKEKIWFLVLGALAAIGAVWLKRAVLIPWITDLTTTQRHSSYLGVPGTTVLSYTLFVGLPLSSAIVSLALLWRGFRILKAGQVPPPGERVFRRTAIRRGSYSRAVGFAHFVPTLLLLCLALWGYWQAEQLAHLLLRKDA
jgi:hypothetical protein